MKTYQKLIIVLLVFGLFIGGFLWLTYQLPEGYKRVDILDKGTFVVPKEWVATVKAGKLFFTDKPMSDSDYRVYLGETEDRFLEIEVWETFRGGVAGGGICYSKHAYTEGGKQKEFYCINADDVKLIADPALVDESVIDIIASRSSDLTNAAPSQSSKEVIVEN